MNGQYSLRAFARDLELTPSRLSSILQKKQGLSIATASDLARKLKLSEARKTWFINSVGSLHARSEKERAHFKQNISAQKDAAKIFTEIQLEYFKVIADWYHFAILELTYVDGFQSDAAWVARSLKIDTEVAQEAIDRMVKLELLIVKEGSLKDAFKFLATPNDIPSESLKKFNVQLMKKAMESIYEQEVDNREYASNIFSFNKEQLPMVKQKLRDFRRELELEASKPKKKDSVYCLGMQFFELTDSSFDPAEISR